MYKLKLLRKINGYGRMLCNGSHYSIKFRIKDTEKALKALIELQSKYPELIIYHALTGYFLFGGTFHNSGNFMKDKDLVLRAK